MKLRKILAAVAAAAVAVSTMAMNAFAANLIDGDVDVGTDWSAHEIAADKFADAKEGDTVTVSYKIVAADYNLVRLANGWDDLECTQAAVCNNDDPGFNHQDPDFMVVTVDGSVTYTLTATDAENLKANGANILGYSVIVTSVDLASGAAAPADTAADTGAETPAADSGSTAAKTGNVPAAAMVSVMALAGAAAVAAKKRK